MLANKPADRFDMTKKRINLIGIAKLAGVSRSTAGHILNGKAKELRIAEETEKKVLEIASEHGYLRNRSVRQLHANKTFQIAFITTSEPDEIPGIPNPIAHMMDCLQKKGYQTLIINVDVTSHEISPIFSERCFDGMVIFGTVPNQDFIVEWGKKHEIPHVFLHHDSASKNNVGIDEEKTANELLNKLCAMGFSRIAFYSPRNVGLNALFPADYIFSREKYLEKAIRLRGLKIYPNSVEQRKQNENAAEFLMRELPEPPECVITSNLYHAMHFSQYLNETGKKSPEDVAILTCAFDRLNAICAPSMCGIDYDFRKMGEDLAEMILKRIKTGKECQNKLTPGKLITETKGILLTSLNYKQQ